MLGLTAVACNNQKKAETPAEVIEQVDSTVVACDSTAVEVQKDTLSVVE